MTVIDLFILKPIGMSQGGAKVAMARLVKLLRVVRIVKVIRFMNSFSELRVLIKTLTMSIQSLAWSVLLIGGVILAGGVFMVQLLVGFMEVETRKWVYGRFGGSARATYTMFEATFTGSWVASARPLIEDVGPEYALFWVLYVVGINF